MMRGQRGFSLIELVIVIALIGIILAIATLDFGKMQRKGQIEKQTRQMLADLQNLRLQAVYGKQPKAVVLQPDQYIFKRYSSENEDPSAGAEVSKQTVTYEMTAPDGTSVAGQTVRFDARGAADFNLTLRMNPTGSGASVDCIIIDAFRTGMGKMESGKCVLK